MTTLIPPKYRSLSHLLDTLDHTLKAGLIEVDERWRDNEEALGLRLSGEPELHAFIFTYGQAAGRYGIELSFPREGALPSANEALVQEELSLARLLGLLRAHFSLPEVA